MTRLPRLTLMTALAVLMLAVIASPLRGADRELDFNRDVRPILSENCLFCHGPDPEQRKAGLRLDVREIATAARPEYTRIAIVPGDAERSELVRRIFHEDPGERMPPKQSHKKLTDAEKQTLKQWIEQGAPFAVHWAYAPPRDREPPAVRNTKWPANFIDPFVLARLEAEGLAPAPDADRITLIRRATFDLTGLPPTPAEVEAFVSDTSPDAYEKLIDRLLASPHFGERMAVWWLDLVRFADTVGYHGDQTHRVWPYRDYVIHAFNANKPFDQFIVEQLAGDLLDDPTQAQLVATCYNRLLQTTHEGGAQLKEYRAIYMADRVRNFSQVFMGATVGCAQCHSHKYDPYNMRDFYTLGAFFADVEDEEHLVNQYGGLNTLPTRRLPELPVITAEMADRAAALDGELAAMNQRLEAARAQVVASLDEHERGARQRLADRQTTRLVITDDGSAIGGRFDGAITTIEGDAGPVHSGKSSRLQQSNGQTQHVLRGIASPIEVQADDALYAWVYLDQKHPPKAIMLQFQIGGRDWEHRAVWGGDEISFGRKPKSHAGYQRMGKLPAAGAWVRIEAPASKLGLKPGQQITEVAYTQFGGRVYWDQAGLVRGSAVPGHIEAILNTPGAKRSDKQAAALREYLVSAAPSVIELTKQRDALAAQREKLDKDAPRVMYTHALDEPRTVRILPRGNWLDETGEIVQPAIPQFMGKLETAGRRANRLDLARWLVQSPERGGVAGLTARVQVNRFWELLMGVGLARVLDDFGGQGEPPTHPALLDRLAVEFVRSGWDVKHMMKAIMMSRAYRQSSVAPSQVRQRDPDNRLYARQASPRLDAEFIRDNALAVSGLLVRDLGGPSVNPYQPPGYYRHLNFPGRRYQQHDDARQWRRGVYVHWQRQFLHPMLKAFDAPTREECAAGRPESNTPTQALVLLNDPTFVEAARSFAARIVREGGSDDAARLRFAFTSATSREPTNEEAKLLTDLLDKHRAYFTEHPSEAAKVRTVGLAPTPMKIDDAQLAAWTSVARTLLNLNETITRN